MNPLRPIIALFIFVALAAFAYAEDPPTPQELCDAAAPAPLTMMQFAAAEQVLDPDLDYRAIFCTSAGAIYVDLYERLTPVTVNNFVFLAGQGYYDGTTFHRVIPDFMAQAGDPTGTGRGGPGYQFADEPIGYLTFDRPGLLAMANAGPGTNGSQFFITTAPTPHLNFKHTIFGDVLVGQENVVAIRERDPGSATGPGEALQTVLIITDPSKVDNSGAPELALATQDEVVAAFEAFGQGLPAILAVSEESGLFSTEDLVAGIPSDMQAAFEAYAEDYGHKYRFRLNLLNGDCAENVFFTSLGYQVDVFENAEYAYATLGDGFHHDLQSYLGYQLIDGAVTYMRPAIPCAGGAGAHILTFYTHGRFLVTIDVLVDLDVLDAVPGPRELLYDLVFQIEGAFASIYLPELR